MLSDGSDLTRAGNAFHALAAAAGKVRSPSVERLVGGTSSVTVSLDRACRLMLRLWRCDGRTQFQWICIVEPVAFTSIGIVALRLETVLC